jgi:hypothetical protein
VVGQSCGLGEEILERRAFDLFHLAAGAVAGIEIILKEGSEVDLFERIFLFDRGDGIFFGGSLSGGAVEVFFLAADLVDQRN